MCWIDMKKRCIKPNGKNAKYYCLKGIRVCKQWLDFMTFYDWAMSNGYRNDLVIDRINSNSNYKPSNCRWVTKSENSNVQKGKKVCKRGHKWKPETTYYYSGHRTCKICAAARNKRTYLVKKLNVPTANRGEKL